MQQYLDVLQKILDEGVEKESGRANMPNTIGISKADIRMDLSKGFPLLTTKKMYWKGIIHELLWFLRGETNIKYLVDNNVNIWNGDAYRWYLKMCKEKLFNKEVFYETQEDFVNALKNLNNNYFNGDIFGGKYTEEERHLNDLLSWDYVLGDLGKVYGYQWRNQNGVDQVKDVIDALKNNPYSRYHIIDGWNKADFVDMALPPCHLLYQFIVRPLTFKEREAIAIERGIYSKEEFTNLVGKKVSDEEYVPRLLDEEYNIPKFYLDLNMYQRSVDTPLGCPYNLASMSLLLMIIAKTSNMIAGVANWIGGDTHVYVNQLDGIKEQLKRKPYSLPELKINSELNSLDDILNLSINDFELINYKSHPKIEYILSVGLKKK